MTMAGENDYSKVVYLVAGVVVGAWQGNHFCLWQCYFRIESK